MASRPTTRQAAPIEVQILALNDFHGNIVPPPPIEIAAADGTKSMLASGGVARLAAALATRRLGHPHSVTVSAGDLIGASPFVVAADQAAAPGEVEQPEHVAPAQRHRPFLQPLQLAGGVSRADQ